jgi:outer membrane protein OmpA-like peptidoglycan-associated protein
MQLRNILLAATLVAVPATLQAQPVTGWYVGAGVGVNQLLDMGVSNAPAGSKYTSSLGLVALGSVGYGFGGGLRAELEGNFRTQDSKLKNGAVTVGKGTAKTYGPMLNLLYDIDLGAGVTPYVGAGIGAQWMSLSGRGNTDSQAAAAAQGILGLALPVNPNLSVTAEARVLGWLGDAKFQGASLKSPTNVSGLLGLRYAFGAPAPMAAPAAAPAPAPTIKAEEARPYLVFFDWDKADLTARARQIIADAAGASQRLAVTRIEVAGHADKTGTATYNQGLSMKRAQAVGAELTRLGVKKESIMISAFGDTKPLVPTADGVREPQNRRVEIVLK